MKTLKKHLKEENVKSYVIKNIVENYRRKNMVKIALYSLKDCIHITDKKAPKDCIELIEKWLKGEKVKKNEIQDAAENAYHSRHATPPGEIYIFFAAAASVGIISCNISAAYQGVMDALSSAAKIHKNRNSKLGEYLSYARLFAYEDLSFPYKDISKTFDLDNPTDLNIFLDFLTDHYPEAITYPREEYFTNKLAKEYLKVIYQ